MPIEARLKARLGQSYLRTSANLTENCLKPRAFKLKTTEDESNLLSL